MCAEITKKAVVKKFYHGAVLMKLVPYKGQDTNPNGVAFYVNNGIGGVIGVRVYPDGRKVAVNPTKTITDGSKRDKNRGKPYLKFNNAWGRGKSILASRAVYTAWHEKTIPDGMTIDHIDGMTFNNDFRNLRCISNDENCRDGGFLTKLQHRGFNPARIERAYLLRFYERMAYIKANISRRRYEKLTKEQLRSILFLPDEELQIDSLIQTLKTKKNYAKRFEKTAPTDAHRTCPAKRR